MIRVYTSDVRTFENNGEVILLPNKARVKCEDNGEFYIDIECDVKYSKYIVNENIIVAPTPAGEQAFRIISHNITNRRIEARADHVYFDSKNYLITDKYIVNMKAYQAIGYLNTNATPPNCFNYAGGENFGSEGNYRVVRTSLKDAIDEIINRWGGHLIRDNWDVQILQDIGTDNGITIEYKKNLEEIKATYDYNEVVTQLLPVGKDGTLLDSLWIYGTVSYDIPHVKCVEFNQEIEEEDYGTHEAYVAALKADLRRQANDYIKVYQYPQVNYELKANPEKVTNIGDKILVRDKELNIELLTQVLSYEYDALTGRYTALEFGNYKTTVKSAILKLVKGA